MFVELKTIVRHQLLLPPAYVLRREGNSFTLFVNSHPGGGQVSPGGGGGCQVQPAGGVRSSRGGSGPAGRGGSGQSSQGGSGPAGGGGSASCALLRAVCLLRSRRRTFLFSAYSQFSFRFLRMIRINFTIHRRYGKLKRNMV